MRGATGLGVVLVFVCAPVCVAHADEPVAALRSELAKPDSKIDFAEVKVRFDKLVDPRVDARATLSQVDAMTNAVRTMAGPNATPIQRLTAVRRFIYTDGPWNQHKPFKYDLADPLGLRPVNRLLSTYLKTRRGNCVSMPLLFLALADRAGIHVSLSTAPQHEFVKYIDDASGKIYNIETTSGGYPARDAWYRQNLSMSDKAIRNGVYLKTLSRKQGVAVIAWELADHALQKKQYQMAIALSDLILAQYPQFPVALVDRGVAYGGLVDTEFRPKYPRPTDIPRDLLPKYLAYVRNAEASFNRLDMLGWQQTDGEPETQ